MREDVRRASIDAWLDYFSRSWGALFLLVFAANMLVASVAWVLAGILLK